MKRRLRVSRSTNVSVSHHDPGTWTVRSTPSGKGALPVELGILHDSTELFSAKVAVCDAFHVLLARQLPVRITPSKAMKGSRALTSARHRLTGTENDYCVTRLSSQVFGASDGWKCVCVHKHKHRKQTCACARARARARTHTHTHTHTHTPHTHTHTRRTRLRGEAEGKSFLLFFFPRLSFLFRSYCMSSNIHRKEAVTTPTKAHTSNTDSCDSNRLHTKTTSARERERERERETRKRARASRARETETQRGGEGGGGGGREGGTQRF